MKSIFILVIVAFIIGFFIGSSNAKEKIVYQTKTEYVRDPTSVSKTTFDTEIAKTRTNSYNTGYTEGRKIGIDEGYRSGYTQGTEYGRNLILSEIDLRMQEAERTDTNIPLFRVR